MRRPGTSVKYWKYPMSSSLDDSLMQYGCNYVKVKKREVFLDIRWEDMETLITS